MGTISFTKTLSLGDSQQRLKIGSRRNRENVRQPIQIQLCPFNISLQFHMFSICFQMLSTYLTYQYVQHVQYLQHLFHMFNITERLTYPCCKYFPLVSNAFNRFNMLSHAFIHVMSLQDNLLTNTATKYIIVCILA